MKKLLFVATLFISSMVQAQSSQVFQKDGKAIKGYDAVAFFTEAKAVEGVPAFTRDWNGAKWFFSSQANLDSFTAMPEKYAPQYGGYCAFGTAQGHKAPTETDTWTVVDGKLYFNYNQKVKSMWSKDTKNQIESADKKWETIKDN